MKRAPNFNPIARAYRWMEWLTFGPMLSRCRCAFLDDLTACRAALILGDGDGRFTARLLAQNSTVLVDAVDASRAMLFALVGNAGIHSSRVRIHLADVRLGPPLHPPYDLIVTHFFLDCLTTDEIAALALRLRACVTPQAQWVVSDFAIPPGWFGWLVARPLVTALYFAFWLLTGLRVGRLPDHHRALTAAGFALAHQKQFLRGLLISQIWVPAFELRN
jgi:SAM-dependent methyltransferase